MLEERMINSDSCNNNLCSTSFTTKSSFSSNQSYLISVYAINVFGQSNTAVSTSIENSLQSEVLSPRLTFEDCVTTLLCSSVLAEGPCVVQYGQDSSYENFDNNHLNVSLNSPFPLQLMDTSTQYYFQVEVRINSRSRRSFVTGEFPVPLTDANIGLLITGTITLMIIDIIIFIVWLSLFLKQKTASTKHQIRILWIVSLVLLLVAVFLWLVSVCLWIAVGGVVGQQRNICDSEWQSNRDNLIIAAFVLSFISLLFFITSSAVAIYKKLLNEKIATEKPTWNPDTEMCEVCQKNPTQMFKRHHCRACGKCVCSPCSQNKAYLPYNLKEAQRVCYLCYDICKNQGIKIVTDTVTEESETEEDEGPGVLDQVKAGVTEMIDYIRSEATKEDHSHLMDSSTGTITETGPDFTQDGKAEQPIKFATEEPTWNPDTEVCEVCQKNQTRKFKRHHCRACGKCVCSSCSQNKAYLPYEPKKAERVCYLCYDICKNEGIKTVADTVTEESETEEEIPHDPPNPTESGTTRSENPMNKGAALDGHKEPQQNLNEGVAQDPGNEYRVLQQDEPGVLDKVKAGVTGVIDYIFSEAPKVQLNFLHLENNAEDDDMSTQTPPEQRQQSAPAAV